MRKLIGGFILALCSICSAQVTPAASDNNVVVGNPAQPVDWLHRDSLQHAILAAQPSGTVWIPATYHGTDCNPYSVCNPGNVLIIDLRNGFFNTFPVSGGGSCAGACVTSVFGRNGPTVTATAADYGTVGIQQPGAGGTLTIATNSTGTLNLGSVSGSFVSLAPGGWSAADVFGDQFLAGGSGANFSLLAGGGLGGNLALTTTDLTLAYNGAAPGTNGFDCNKTTGCTFALPINVPSCTGCSGNPFAVDQFQVGTGAGTSTFLTAVQGALAYNTFGGGSQNLHQAGCADLVGGCNGTGAFVLTTGASLVNPNIGNATATTLTVSGNGPTQIDMQYSGTTEHAPTAGHSYVGVDTNGALLFSSNAGNQFLPGPSSALIPSGCGGTVGAANSTAYIGWPANQSTTTCSGSVLSATIIEVPFAAPGTLKNYQCSISTAGIANDQIVLYVNNAATSLHCQNGTSNTCSDNTHTTSVNAGDTWSSRYVVASSGSETAAGWRCTFEYVRTP